MACKVIYNGENYEQDLVRNVYNKSLNEGLGWLGDVLPNTKLELVDGLINDIGKGSYNTVSNLIQLSKDYADKGTVKHEAVHKVLNLLPKEQKEAILNAGSEKYGIKRDKSNAKIKYSQAQQNQINYTLKSVDILQSKKAEQVFEKGEKNNWDLNKILTELQIPKEQKEILLNKTFESGYFKELGLRENLIMSVITENSFAIEVNVTKAGTKRYDEFENSEYYSNLTVPGGINYTENEIATPSIIPNIKGHAQFSTDNGIGWFRSDEQAIGNKTITEQKQEQFELGTIILSELEEDKTNSVATKTRRILEVQSDLFQKGRDKEFIVETDITLPLSKKEFEESLNYYDKSLTEEAIKTYTPGYLSIMGYSNMSKEEYVQNLKGHRQNFINEYNDSIEEYNNNIKELSNYQNFKNQNQFLQLLNQNHNWVTVFVKSIIQDSVNKGYEKVLFPTSEVVRVIQGFEEIAEKYSKAISKLKNERTQEDNLIISEWEKDSTKKTIKGTLDFYNNLRNTLDNFVGGNKTDREKGIYKLHQITDEYGNTWNAIDLSDPKVKEQTENILFQSTKLQYTGDLAIEEKIAEEAETSSDRNKGIIAEFIQRVKDFLNDLFNNIDKIDKLIRDLNKGKFKELSLPEQNELDLINKIKDCNG